MQSKVLVLGGKGFIGRHAVLSLQEHGAEVVIGTRTPNLSSNIPERSYRLEKMTSSNSWKESVNEFDVILNCVGILRPSGASTYDKVHHLAPSAIASACINNSNVRFVHVSALGLTSRDRSGFLRSKLDGEQAIKATHSNWIITRPSLLDGDGGYGAEWLRGVAKLPIFATPSDALGGIAALTASDLGEALARLCLSETTELNLDSSRIFELGGTKAYKFENYIRGLRRRYTDSRAIAIPLPGIVARAGAHLCDLFRITPFSYGHWELLRKDNIPKTNRLPELLGRAPTEVIPEAYSSEYAIESEHN